MGKMTVKNYKNQNNNCGRINQKNTLSVNKSIKKEKRELCFCFYLAIFLYTRMTAITAIIMPMNASA